jgi:malonyl-CoA decarboxylase
MVRVLFMHSFIYYLTNQPMYVCMYICVYVYRESSASLIEQISYHEAVHRVRTLSDLKQRLGVGRRVWAFVHDALSPQPLIFVETALTTQIPPSIDDILMVAPPNNVEHAPTHCIFYSICSTHAGFQGT